MPWPQTGATQYHAQLGLPDKGHAIKGLVVCNSWDLEPWDLLNGLALGYYQPSHGMCCWLCSWASSNGNISANEQKESINKVLLLNYNHKNPNRNEENL